LISTNFSIRLQFPLFFTFCFWTANTQTEKKTKWCCCCCLRRNMNQDRWMTVRTPHARFQEDSGRSFTVLRQTEKAQECVAKLHY